MMDTRTATAFVLSTGLLALSGCKKEAVPGEPGDYVGRCVVPAFTGESKICFEVRDDSVSEDKAIEACENLYGSGDAGDWTPVSDDADKYFDGCPKPDFYGDSELRLYGRCDGFVYKKRRGDNIYYAHAYFYGPFDESGNSQSWGCEGFDEATYYPAMEMPGDLVSSN